MGRDKVYDFYATYVICVLYISSCECITNLIRYSTEQRYESICPKCHHR